MASQPSGQSQPSLQPVSQLHGSLSGGGGGGGGGREQKDYRSSRSSQRKGSDSSVPEEDKDKRDEAAGRG